MTALPVLSILSFRGNIIFQCPRCHSTVGGFERKKYCRYCGQKLRYLDMKGKNSKTRSGKL